MNKTKTIEDNEREWKFHFRAKGFTSTSFLLWASFALRRFRFHYQTQANKFTHMPASDPSIQFWSRANCYLRSMRTISQRRFESWLIVSKVSSLLEWWRQSDSTREWNLLSLSTAWRFVSTTKRSFSGISWMLTSVWIDRVQFASKQGRESSVEQCQDAESSGMVNDLKLRLRWHAMSNRTIQYRRSAMSESRKVMDIYLSFTPYTSL